MNEKDLCPVPRDQRPINEYLELKNRFGFSWADVQSSDFYKFSLKIYIIVLLFFTLFFYNSSLSIISVSLYSNLIACSILFIFYLRLYLGWHYIYNRLMKATVAYEESGWYDGQIWVKTPEFLIQDKLAGKYQVEPIVNRIKRILLIFLLTLFVTSFFLFFC